MGKARKKNIKSAKREILRASSEQKMMGDEEKMDNLLKIFQRLQNNK